MTTIDIAQVVAAADRRGSEPAPEIEAAFQNLDYVDAERVTWFAAGARWGSDHAMIRLPASDDTPFIAVCRRLERTVTRACALRPVLTAWRWLRAAATYLYDCLIVRDARCWLDEEVGA